MCAIPVGKKCSVINCNKTAVAKGLCDMHRKRLARHGTTDDEVGKLILKGYVKLDSHPLYDVWRNFTRYKNGSEVCERWKRFELFVEDVGEKPEGDFCLKRIDSTKNFSYDNVRWEPIERGTQHSEVRKEYMRKYSKRMRDENPDYFFSHNLKKYYGIDANDYNRMLKNQNGVCAICGREERRRDKFGNLMRLHVDHCHKSHTVRGLLCNSCNTAIGHFEDNTEYLQKAILYLSND